MSSEKVFVKSVEITGSEFGIQATVNSIKLAELILNSRNDEWGKHKCVITFSNDEVYTANVETGIADSINIIKGVESYTKWAEENGHYFGVTQEDLAKRKEMLYWMQN